MSEEKKQQVMALGRLGWTLRLIEQTTGVRRETAGASLKAAGIAVRPPAALGRRAPAKAVNEVTTDSGAAKPALEVTQELGAAKPANEVTTDFDGQILRGQELQPPNQDPSASACEPYRESIELGLSQGRNAIAIWQDLVSKYGFGSGYQTLKRFVCKLRGSQLPQAAAIEISLLDWARNGGTVK